MTQKALMDGTLVSEVHFQIACGIVMEAHSLKSTLKHKDVIDAIAKALDAERVATRHECIMEFGTDAEMGYQVGA